MVAHQGGSPLGQRLGHRIGELLGAEDLVGRHAHRATDQRSGVVHRGQFIDEVGHRDGSHRMGVRHRGRVSGAVDFQVQEQLGRRDVIGVLDHVSVEVGHHQLVGGE